jgi:hypothetical protein
MDYFRAVNKDRHAFSVHFPFTFYLFYFLSKKMSAAAALTRGEVLSAYRRILRDARGMNYNFRKYTEGYARDAFRAPAPVDARARLAAAEGVVRRQAAVQRMYADSAHPYAIRAPM